MGSPFPGMDPYLEDPAFWPDFHRRFITYCADALIDLLPASYEARVDEQVRLVEFDGDKPQRFLPDVAVIHGLRGRPEYEAATETNEYEAETGRAAGGRGGAGRSGSVATLEPVTLREPHVIEVRDVWIELLHLPERTLVTVIEVLSPSNKCGTGFGEYWARRCGLREQRIHLVELDLLASGQRMFEQAATLGDYFAFVTRAERNGKVDAYAWTVRDPLPTIPIPLKAPDPDIGLDLAAVFATAYERGRYARSLRYTAPPPDGFSDAARAWVAERGQAFGTQRKG